MPSTNIQLYMWNDASQISTSMRSEIMRATNSIIRTHAVVTEDHWTADRHPFHEDFGIVCGRKDGRLIAVSIYRRLIIDGTPAIYRSGTVILPEHHGAGLYGLMTRMIVGHALSQSNALANLFYCWRTRNPIIWSTSAALCDSHISLDWNTQQERSPLWAQCVKAVAQLHPDSLLEPSSLIMRGVYRHIRPTPHGVGATLQPLQMQINALVPDPEDALFGFGTISRNGYAGYCCAHANAAQRQISIEKSRLGLQ